MREKHVKYPGLASIMASHGDTQTSLAGTLGISVSAVNRRMSGEVEWSLGEIKAICEYYEKSYYELFEA